jgi:two-component system response regulator RpaA
MSRVLVIDDEGLIATILGYAFEVQGHETLAADGGLEGIEIARAEHPDAIVLDLMMPTVNGIDVLEVLREDDVTSEIPILVLTAVTMSREHARCMSCGADMVMTKPFDPRDVALAVDDLMSAESSAAASTV